MTHNLEKDTILLKIYRFYRDGFRSMTLGRTLWKVIIIKLIIIFGVLKLFFFQGFLESRFSINEEKAAYVLDQITQPAAQNTTYFGGER